MNSRIYFKVGTIFAWKEYKWYERLWYALRFKKLPFNKFYVCTKRRIPYFEHVSVFSPIDTSKERQDKIRTYFGGGAYFNNVEELLKNMQFIDKSMTDSDPSKWKNYRFRMRW